MQEDYVRVKNAAQAAYSVPPARPETQLERACSEIERLCTRITELTGKVSHAAERLYGPRPECANGTERECFNEGLSGRILDGLATLSSRLSDAEEQVNRLEV